jgi:hypothetical protein
MKRGAKWGIVLGAVGGMLGLAGAIVGILMASEISTNHLTGTITSSGGELGAWTIQPDSCQSGEREQFRGVQLFAGDSNKHGTAFISPFGGEQQISINLDHGGKARLFSSSDCKVLDGEIQRQNSRVNRIYNVSGHVRFDCTYNEEHVTGDLTFENCH